MNIRILTTLLWLLAAGTVQGQLKLRFDLTQAQQALVLLSQKERPDEKQLAAFTALPGTGALAQKVHSSPDTARFALLHAWEGKALSGQERAFRFSGIYKYRDTLAAFLDTLSRNLPALADSVQRALEPFAPAGRNTSVTVYVLFGGPSIGFTLGDDSAFYLGLQFYNFDVNAVRETCKHELLHNLQSARYNSQRIAAQLDSADRGAAAAYALIAYLFKEGSAEFLADLDRAPQTPKIRELAEHAAVNRSRSEDAFYLFERMLVDVYQNPDSSNFDRAYSVLFDWGWNNPGYYLGKRMLQRLQEQQGAEVLKRYIGKDPTVFLQDYIALSKTRPELEGSRFSPQLERILAQVAAKVRQVSIAGKYK